jgi:hypothetical protein
LGAPPGGMIYRCPMSPAKPPKKKLTDSERHTRFVDMAKEVGASGKPQDFDQAFKAVTKKGKAP